MSVIFLIMEHSVCKIRQNYGFSVRYSPQTFDIPPTVNSFVLYSTALFDFENATQVTIFADFALEIQDHFENSVDIERHFFSFENGWIRYWFEDPSSSNQ